MFERALRNEPINDSSKALGLEAAPSDAEPGYFVPATRSLDVEPLPLTDVSALTHKPEAYGTTEEQNDDAPVSDYAYGVKDGPPSEPATPLSDRPQTPITDLFSASSGELRLAQERGQLRSVFEALEASPESVSPATSSHYENCVLDHAALKHRAHEAKTSLQQAMGTHDVVYDTDGAEAHTSWHYREHLLGDGTTTQQAYEVQVRYSGDGTISSSTVYGADVQVSRRALHEPLTVDRPDDLPIGPGFFASDTGSAGFRYSDISEQDFGVLADSLTHDDRRHSWNESVRPWAASFAALPPVDENYIAGALTGDPDNSVEAVLIRSTADTPQDAENALTWCFEPNMHDKLVAMLERPIEEIADTLQQPGVRERYEWFIANAEGLYTAVRSGEAVALERLGEKYQPWAHAREAEITQLETLVHELEQTLNITDRQPYRYGDLVRPDEASEQTNAETVQAMLHKWSANLRTFMRGRETKS